MKHSLGRLLGRNKTVRFKVDFNDGPCVEIVGASPPLLITMSCGNQLIHSAKLAGNHWTRAHIKYLKKWQLEVLGDEGQRVFSHHFDVTDRTVRVNIDSRSLGDTLAWVPQVVRFSEAHPDTSVYISHFWPDLFDGAAYSKLNYIDPDRVLENCYATFNIGYYFDRIDHAHPADPRCVPLGQVAADILGLSYLETRPRLSIPPPVTENRQRPYVCIATASTAECKHWLYPNGWQQLVDHLDSLGFDCVVIQKEPTRLLGVEDQTGDQPIGRRVGQILGSAFFIGLGSGLSWLAWALDKPVVLVSGFSQPWAEFSDRCYRVINQSVCHGCWNDSSHLFDRGDWHWCPNHKGSERAFECSREISPKRVFEAVSQLIEEQL